MAEVLRESNPPNICEAIAGAWSMSNIVRDRLDLVDCYSDEDVKWSIAEARRAHEQHIAEGGQP